MSWTRSRPTSTSSWPATAGTRPASPDASCPGCTALGTAGSMSWLATPAGATCPPPSWSSSPATTSARRPSSRTSSSSRAGSTPCGRQAGGRPERSRPARVECRARRLRQAIPPVRFGLIVPQGWILDLVDIEDPIEQYETMSRVAQTAERLGFDSIWLFDHFHTYHEPVLETTLECWTSTAALARDTSRIRLRQMVTCNGYRNPALLAKMASTVDVLSHGRLDFGIGAGWYEHEYKAYGYNYPSTPDRLRMLGEALQ